MNNVQQIAPDVVRIPVKIGNCYLVGDRNEWVLLDAGTEGNHDRIRSIAEEHFGEDARPEAIILTHGHFDTPDRRARSPRTGTCPSTHIVSNCRI